MAEPEYPYRYTWSTGECGPRRGQLCKITRSRNGFRATQVQIEFQDGAKFVVSRAALHRVNTAR